MCANNIYTSCSVHDFHYLPPLAIMILQQQSLTKLLENSIDGGAKQSFLTWATGWLNHVFNQREIFVTATFLPSQTIPAPSPCTDILRCSRTRLTQRNLCYIESTKFSSISGNVDLALLFTVLKQPTDSWRSTVILHSHYSNRKMKSSSIRPQMTASMSGLRFLAPVICHPPVLGKALLYSGIRM